MGLQHIQVLIQNSCTMITSYMTTQCSHKQSKWENEETNCSSLFSSNIIINLSRNWYWYQIDAVIILSSKFWRLRSVNQLHSEEWEESLWNSSVNRCRRINFGYWLCVIKHAMKVFWYSAKHMQQTWTAVNPNKIERTGKPTYFLFLHISLLYPPSWIDFYRLLMVAKHLSSAIPVIPYLHNGEEAGTARW